MIRIREKELTKFAEIVQMPYADVHKLYKLGVLDEKSIIDQLIAYDFRRVKASRKYTVKQIIQALIDEYQVSRGKVQTAIYNKRRKTYACSQCGRPIGKGEYERNKAKCDVCISKTIDL